MNAIRVAAMLMLSTGGVYAGIVVAFAVERIDLWSRMPVDQYAVDFRRSIYRVDPLQPILASVATLAAGYFSWASDGTARTLAVVGVALLIALFAGSVFIAEPINSRFRDLPEGQAPAQAIELRDRWRRFHLVRTVGALAALGALTVAAFV